MILSKTKPLKIHFHWTLLLACTIPILITTLRWSYHGHDISMFILAGDKKVDKELHPFDIRVYENSTGYDGQYFYQLALDPFSTDEMGYGINSSYDYRKQRIFYPLLVFLASMGNQEIVPHMMVLVNLLAFFISFYFIRKILLNHNCNPNYVLLWAIYSGSYIAFSRNLAEVVAISLVIIAIHFWSVRRIWLFSLVTTCALFTRDDTIIVLLPFWVHLFWISYKRSAQKLLNISSLFIPFASLLIWKLYIISNFGIYKPIQFTSFPLSGIVLGVKETWIKTQIDSKNYLYLLYSVAYLIWHIWTVRYAYKFWSFRKNDLNSLLSVGLFTWTSLAFFFNAEIYSDDTSYARILSTLTLISFLMIAINKNKLNAYYLSYTVGTFIVVFCKITLFL